MNIIREHSHHRNQLHPFHCEIAYVVYAIALEVEWVFT